MPPRVRERAEAIWKDAALVATADAAYARYLEPRGALVHGDVQAGNVLLPGRGAVLLDAEIAHVGDPAFDAGTFVAHLAAPFVARERQAEAKPLVAAFWAAYAEGGRFADVARYAGLELARRTIGAARMRATQDEEGALRVLATAVRWIREPASTPAGLT
jgi:5-methylthioribose kinase